MNFFPYLCGLCFCTVYQEQPWSLLPPEQRSFSTAMDSGSCPANSIQEFPFTMSPQQQIIQIMVMMPYLRSFELRGFAFHYESEVHHLPPPLFLFVSCEHECVEQIVCI